MKNILVLISMFGFVSSLLVTDLHARDWKEYTKKKTKKIGKKFSKSVKKRKKKTSTWFISKKIKSDEYVLFYPALASMDEQAQYWTVNIHGLIYEHTAFSKSVPFISKLIGVKNLKAVKKVESVYRERLGWFFVDNESRKQLKIVLHGKTYELQPSGKNGHFYGTIRIPVTEVDRWALDEFGRTEFRAVTTAYDERVFRGSIHFVHSYGVSVISDIDDTIKVSDVHDKKLLIRNTFFKHFKAIPGMAKNYSRWFRNQDVRFHYVTSSPWQLYVPLRKFLHNKKFPPGSFHMKLFRVKDRSFFNVFSKSLKYKVDSITSIIQKYPRRHFILIGDSGEKDLQVYSKIANKYPGRVNVIYIRDTGHSKIKNRRGKRIVGLTRHAPTFVFDTFDKPARLRYFHPRTSE